MKYIRSFPFLLLFSMSIAMENEYDPLLDPFFDDPTNCLAPTDCPPFLEVEAPVLPEPAFTNSFAMTPAVSHHSDQPAKPSFKCDECLRIYSTKSLLMIHITRSHAPKKFVCQVPTCTAQYAFAGNLAKHHARKHFNVPETVSFMGLKVPVPAQPEIFIFNPQTTAPIFKPMAYPKSSKTATEKKFTCSEETCLKQFPNKKELALHFARSHQDEKPFGCEKCPSVYSTKSSLNVHYNRIHGPKKFVCAIQDCTAQYAYAGDLNHHQKRTHPLELTDAVGKKKPKS